MDPIAEPHPGSGNGNSGYAFITHSQETLPLNLPPSIDNATLARRRRRRTSAHDQAILEEEYRKCDRPDKSKRREITAKVQMGEKEVQIWFQNKRQSTRRKSKPLLPHEIIPHNSQNSISSSQQSLFESSQSFSSSQTQESNSNSNYDHNSQNNSSTVGGGGSIRRSSASFSSVATAAQFPDTFSDDVLHSQGGGEYLGVSDVDDDDEEPVRQSHQQSYQVAQRKPSSTATGQTSGHKSNNLSLASVISSPSCPENSHSATTEHHYHQHQKTSLVIDGEGEQGEGEDGHEMFTQITMTTSAHNRLQRVLSSAPAPVHHYPPPGTSRRRTAPTTPKNPPRLLKRSSSIRLSTSLEGKASVVLEDEPSSPPPPLLALRTPKIQPSSVSRSALKRRTIDSKVWEFCCDNQAVIRSPCQPHDEPSEATEALGLVRERGNSSAHKPLLKDNSVGNSLGMVKPKKNLQKAIPSSSPIKAKKSRKIISAKSARPKPALSNNANANPSTATAAAGNSSKKPRTNPLLPEPGQDSDKENRPPGAPKKKRPAGKNKTPRRGSNKSSSDKEKRRVLEETRSEGMRIFYDVPPTSSQVCETEYELPGASGGGSQSFFDESSQESAGPGRVDEMECVENLLSLRGGVWG
ncbi:hypothetical protein B9Z19DRAFT_1091171 [Tuber borchii]|uniref:Homeobox domain-containing protein n=1 Tax=Tuber borchii TaxID=42251 RepID=A0A2T6ZHU0_TUBBO|nr:hypothetical protein B9Z19DRAFT_1091171 [Tuber borchii]